MTLVTLNDTKIHFLRVVFPLRLPKLGPNVSSAALMLTSRLWFAVQLFLHASSHALHESAAQSFGTRCAGCELSANVIDAVHSTEHGLQGKKNEGMCKTPQTMATHKKFCATCGVMPHQFLSDNGSSFTSEEFRKHLEQFSQSQRHSGVGAHHSNGIAEQNISTIMAIARAMMHHQAIHWPDVAQCYMLSLS